MTGADVVKRAEATRQLRTDADVLRYLNLDPTRPETVALFALARRYGLDPLLRQVEVLPTKQGPRAYISRDGYLALAHRTGQLRGIRTVDASEGEHGWRATVEVLTADGGVYSDNAGAGFDEPNIAKGGVDPERMAIARAERRALKRAFSALAFIADDAELYDGAPVDDDQLVEVEPVPAALPAEHEPDNDRAAPPAPVEPARSSPTEPRPQANPASGSTVRPDHGRQRAARERFNTLGEQQRTIFRRQYAIADLSLPWPDAALDALLGPVEWTDQERAGWAP